ncbi:MAG: IclR family transcriptional regulator [Spirochaetales bacterium]|nr:IclR family transcriptional regulator [Spirochaetales bacterium]
MEQIMNNVDDFDKDRESNKYLIPNIARALRILEFLARVKEEASIAQISENFNYPKNSVFRVLKTLEYYGYVEETSRKYRATPRMLYLGYAGMRTKGIVENSIDVMHSLRDEINETILIGTLLGNQVVIIEQLPSFQFIKFTAEIGRRIMLHASAPGKAILSYLPEEEQKNLVNQITFTRYNDNTLPSKSAMMSELETVYKQGFAIDNGEELKDVHCVGAPIFDYRHYPIAAIWIVGPDYRLPSDMFSEVGELVKSHAMKISRRFGYDPGQS